jgi:uncharacterized alpha-E superfamily protein
MQSGGSVADVWIMRDGPAPAETMLDAASFRREDTGTLPSRAADNLYWLGRYIERTEGAVRLLRAYHLRLAETGTAEDLRLESVAEMLRLLSVDPSLPLQTALDPMLSAARTAAGKVRDRFAVDGWAALTDLTSSLALLSQNLRIGDDSARATSVLLRKISGFNGLVHENMHRTSGWRFLTFGRAIERADGVAAVLSGLADKQNAAGLPEVALEYGDCRVTHQRRYRIDAIFETVTDLMLLDANNPRSFQYQVTVMKSIAENLPAARVNGRVSPVLSVLLPLDSELSVAEPSEFGLDRLLELRERLAMLSNHLSATYLV